MSNIYYWEKLTFSKLFGKVDFSERKFEEMQHYQLQKFWGNSMKHNLLRLSLKKPKDSSIKTPLPLPYINVVGQ